MDQETVLQWFCSGIDFRVTKVLKQHWYKSKYSYLNNPRPDFGLMLLVRGSVDFLTEHGTVSAHSGNLVFLSKHSRYEAVFSDEADDYLICFDADEDSFSSLSPMILSESIDLHAMKNLVDYPMKTDILCAHSYLIKAPFCCFWTALWKRIKTRATSISIS